MSSVAAAVGRFAPKDEEPTDALVFEFRLKAEDLFVWYWTIRWRRKPWLVAGIPMAMFWLPTILWALRLFRTSPPLSFVFGLAGATFLLALVAVYYWVWAARMARQVGRGSAARVSYSAAGIHDRDDDGSRFANWSGVRDVLFSRRGIYVNSGQVWYILPRRCFAGFEEMRGADARIRGWWKAAGSAVPAKPI